MAFVISFGRCTIGATERSRLLADWQAIKSGNVDDISNRSLATLNELDVDRRAMLGIESDRYARGWLSPAQLSAGLSLSLVLLRSLVRVEPLPISVWSAMAHDAGSIRLPQPLALRIAVPPLLARWLAACTRSPAGPPEPVDPHIGGWASPQMIARLTANLRGPGEHEAHDAIRHTLCDFGANDWLFVSAIW
jgi:hypothetical protein